MAYDGPKVAHLTRHLRSYLSQMLKAGLVELSDHEREQLEACRFVGQKRKDGDDKSEWDLIAWLGDLPPNRFGDVLKMVREAFILDYARRGHAMNQIAMMAGLTESNARSIYMASLNDGLASLREMRMVAGAEYHRRLSGLLAVVMAKADKGDVQAIAVAQKLAKDILAATFDAAGHLENDAELRATPDEVTRVIEICTPDEARAIAAGRDEMLLAEKLRIVRRSGIGQGIT